MKILALIGIVIISFLSSNAFADTFESFDENNYLFLQISNDKAVGLVRMDGEIASIQSDVKYYKNGNFRTSATNNNFVLFGVPAADSINMTIFDLNNREKITLIIKKLDTDTPYEKTIKKELSVLEKFEQAQEMTGLGNIHAQKELEKLEKEKKKQEQKDAVIIIPRSDYVESQEKEIKILSQIMEHIPYYQQFFFDIRIVDSTINGAGNDFWNDVGFVNDVEIISTIKDPYGKILNEFAGNTTGKGVYASENGTSFYYNSVLRGSYTLEVNATKYFDDSATFTTNYLIKEFFVFIPNGNNSNPQTNSTCGGECDDELKEFE